MTNKVVRITHIHIPEDYHRDGPIKKYEPRQDFDVELEFEDGQIITIRHARTSKCESCYEGYYVVYDMGDEEGFENRCDDCGAKVWGPVYC